MRDASKPSAKTIQAPLPNAIVGLWLREHDPDPQGRVCAKRVPVSARDKREAFAGRSSTKTLDPDPIQSNRIRICCAREQPGISRFIACLCRQPNYRTDNRSHRGPCWTPAALRQNAKNKTPAPWAIRSPGRFLRRRPAAKRPIGGLMAGSLTLLRCGVVARQFKSTAPIRLLASPRVRPMALPVHAIEPRAITVSPCAPVNRKPRIAPGLSEARCLLQGGVRAAFRQVSS